MKNIAIFLITVVVAFSFATFLNGQQIATPPKSDIPQQTAEKSQALANTDQIVRVLLVFLILSIVFEVALTPIFKWRIFLTYCEGKGYKIPFTVILGFLVFWKYNLDIIYDLLIALGYQAAKSFWGQVITSLLIAGGSDGIFKIFTKMGIRNPVENQQKALELRKALLASTEKETR